MIIIVGGSSSGSGKTLFSTKLIKYLKSKNILICAIKATIVRSGHTCPKGSKSCGVCSSLDRDYSLSDEDKVIRIEGKDTNVLYEAGADKVVWLRCKDYCVDPALKELFERYGNFDVILLEGNTIIKYLKPDYSFMVMGEKKKNSFFEVKDKFSVFIDNIEKIDISKILRI